ncbi:MAG: hypothetical protein MRZ73_09930 [Pseudoflavonifractor capillosus]|uniref:hypothetical protein n=1 Tax=Pseudoflavonifractor capillosus TaxID=106588 RepID=UPI0023F9AB48|nr:hypothetical protein [Pseudoflavonifractor capillosus]MCI5928842.1 hypothetical protein [Pseudoflavonifractor capillosus]MDY4660327.1 hypothetical protein [Pseudoflavonifractor capillosus]
MRQYTKRLSILLTALLCIGLLAGCSTDTSNDSTSDDSTDTPANTENTTGTDDVTGGEDNETADLIGEITYANDSYIRIDIYEPDTEITDYTDLGSAVLTDTGTSETVTLDSNAVFECVSSGILYSTTADGLTIGDMVAVTATEDGIQEIIVLEYAPVENQDTETESTEDPAEENGTTEDDSAAEDSSDSSDTSTEAPESTEAPSADSGDSTLVTSAA